MDLMHARDYCLNQKSALVSENPKYPPIMINKEEELEIAGTS